MDVNDDAGWRKLHQALIDRMLRRTPKSWDPTSIIRIMKVSQIIKLLQEDGWVHTTTRGSHRQLTHPTKPGKVTVAGKGSVDLPPGTEKSILRQAGL